MKQFSVFDIRMGRPSVRTDRRCPDASLYGVDPAILRVDGGILPMAGATLHNSNLLMR